MQWHLQLRYTDSQPNPVSTKVNIRAKEQTLFSWSLSTNQGKSSRNQLSYKAWSQTGSRPVKYKQLTSERPSNPCELHEETSFHLV